MLRAPQIRTCSGSLRPLVLRESPAGACSQPKCATWPDGRAVTGWKHGLKEGTPLFMDTLTFPTCKPLLNSESLSQRLKAVRILDYFTNGTCFPSRRRLWDTRPTSLSLTPKTGCYFQRLGFVRAFSLLAPHHVHSKSLWLALPPTRAASQAESHVTGAWRDCLSAQNESRCRQSLVSNLRFYEGNGDGRWMSSRRNQARWASVLVALCSVEGEPAFLFTLRSSKLKGRHKGDVSFAGGKNDLSDRDVVATALRETREELGITVRPESVWGTLQPLRDASAMMIAPVLANLGPLEALSFQPNPEEVEEIFTLSLSHLCNPQNRGYTHFRTGERYGYTLPVFRNGKHRVWGLTATALDHTLKLILPCPPPQ
eukprot:XP_003968849.2 PREDICTED: nucleoside diphosphate-linked moiety X motif 8, mitochondrial isoform X1 [Takifugu rubripes]